MNRGRLPPGTYEMRRLHDAPVQDTWDDAVVSAPAPTLDEVEEELARRRAHGEALREESAELLDGVHGPSMTGRRHREHGDIASTTTSRARRHREHDDLDMLARPNQHSPPVAAGAKGASAKDGERDDEPLVQRRSDRHPRKTEQPSHHRPARPKARPPLEEADDKSRAHGSDPPA